MNLLTQYNIVKTQLRDISFDKSPSRKLPDDIFSIIQEFGGNIHPIHPCAKLIKKKFSNKSHCFGSAFFVLPYRRRFCHQIHKNGYIKYSSPRMIYDYIKIYKSYLYKNKIGKHIYSFDCLIIGRAIRNRI